VRAIAELIDGELGNADYSCAVDEAQARLADPETTPSARLLAELRETRRGFFELAMEAARRNREYFLLLAPMSPDRQLELEREARESVRRQREMEASDRLSFDDYLRRYFAGA
jgi:glutamate--cysteine ligase